MIASIYVEQSRHDTSRVVHYAGGCLRRAREIALRLSHSTTRDCAWIISNGKPLCKYFKGQRFKPCQTV